MTSMLIRATGNLKALVCWANGWTLCETLRCF